MHGTGNYSADLMEERVINWLYPAVRTLFLCPDTHPVFSDTLTHRDAGVACLATRGTHTKDGTTCPFFPAFTSVCRRFVCQGLCVPCVLPPHVPCLVFRRPFPDPWNRRSSVFFCCPSSYPTQQEEPMYGGKFLIDVQREMRGKELLLLLLWSNSSCHPSHGVSGTSFCSHILFS